MTDKTEAWRAAFDERHQFDVYPDHFMSGMRNEFCAGWQAALKSQAASQPKVLTDEQILAVAWKYHYDEPDASGYDFGTRSLLEFARAILESTK